MIKDIDKLLMQDYARFVPGTNSRYSVTKDGMVYSHISKKWLKSFDKSGYRSIQISIPQRITFRVHRMVMLAYIGESSLEVNHKNGVRGDNRLENLEYVTAEENSRHARMFLGRGGSAFGRSCIAIFDDIQVLTILSMTNKNNHEMGRHYRCSHTTIHGIRKGKFYKYLTWMNEGFKYSKKAVLQKKELKYRDAH